MPRPVTIAHPLFRQYFRELRLPSTTETVARSVLNRWYAYLQDPCKAKCCSHRDKAITLQEAKKTDVLDYIHHMKAAKLSPATINNMLVKLRGYYDWSVAAGENVHRRKAMPNPCDGISGESVVV